jgi:hypothetical protein
MSDMPPAYALDFRDLLLAEQLAQRVVLRRVLWLAMHCAQKAGIEPDFEDIRRNLFEEIVQDVATAGFVGASEQRSSALRDHARAIAEGLVMQIQQEPEA